MGKKSSSRRGVARAEGESHETRSKSRHEPGVVSSRLIPLFHNVGCTKAFRDRFHYRPILEARSVNFKELEFMYTSQNVDTANQLVIHGWDDFVKVKRPMYDTLLRILFANLDTTTMISWIGKKKIDLSVESWCRTFEIPNVSLGAENFIMNLSKEDIFHRLTGEHHLGAMSYIKVNQLHQSPTFRMAAQIVMNVLVPKKGSKEQIKVEEGRLIYALLFDAEINLAGLIVERIKGIVNRKSSPICYAMHLVVMMEQAGVTLTCAGDDPRASKSEINHHTLKRLGYTFRHGGWDYVGRGRVNAPHASQGDTRGTHEETFEEVGDHSHEEHTHEESAAPSAPPSQPHSSNVHLSSQLAHLRTFLAEQIHLSQATILSKLNIMDYRLQACEEFIMRSQAQSHPTTTSQDPRGKAPMHTSPTPSPPFQPSPHFSPIPSPQPSHPSPHTSPPHAQPTEPEAQTTSPAPLAQPVSPTSPPSPPADFELVARTPVLPTISPDSEATLSNPPVTTPVLPSPTSPSPPSTAIYKRRKKTEASK